MKLTRYDYIKGCFVQNLPVKPEYWPGTSIQKSKHTAFNWQGAAMAMPQRQVQPTTRRKSHFTI